MSNTIKDLNSSITNVKQNVINLESNVSNNIKKVHNFKHSLPASKEWENNSYSYNKKNLKNLFINNKLTANIIKSYLDIIPFYNIKVKRGKITKRLIRKQKRVINKSLKRAFLSKTEINWTNDKAIITIHLLNRDKDNLVKKMYLLNKAFRESLFLYKHYLNDSMYKSYKDVNLTSLKKYLKQDTNKGKFSSKLNIRSYRFKHMIYVSLQRKKIFLRNIFLLSFIRWSLQIFNIKVLFSQNKKKKTLSIIDKNGNLLLTENVRNMSQLKRLNIKMLFILDSCIRSINNNFSTRNINSLYNTYKTRYLRDFTDRFFKKQMLSMYDLYMLSINNFKFDRFVPLIKILLSKILNRKIELNIITLKYPYLNSSIFTNMIAVRIKRKQSRLLPVFRKFLKLIKFPHKDDRDKNASTKVIINPDMLEMFNFKNIEQSDNKQMDLLNSIKYKWIRGIRIETKGRLTKRYTASRSLFKYRYKGNLRNLDYYNKTSLMLRGDLKQNVNFAFSNSKKRIGAFGVKGWISSKR